MSGPAIFEDDLACDVRDSYRHLLEDRVPDDEATHRIIVEWQGLDAEEEPRFWLALAATQSHLGRLTDLVRGRALEVIDSGRDLDRWQDLGTEPITERRAVLASLRSQLTGPQPPRRVVRRPWRYVTDLKPGNVLSWTASNGLVVLLRVIQIRETREDAGPILEQLAWDAAYVPSADVLAGLPRAPAPPPDPLGGRPAGPIFGPFKFKRRDPDWADVGLTLCDSVPARPGDDRDFLMGAAFLQWVGLPFHLELAVAGLDIAPDGSGTKPQDRPTVP